MTKIEEVARALQFFSKPPLPADEVRGLSREFASGIGTHRCLAAESGDAGGQQQRHAHDDRYAPPRHART